MTAPVVTTVEPTKAKAWMAAISALLTIVVPLILSVSTSLPGQWPAVVGGVIGLLGVLGVYKVPNQPPGTSIVPNDQISTLPPGVGYTPVPDSPPVAPPGGYEPPPWDGTNPYRRS